MQTGSLRMETGSDLQFFRSDGVFGNREASLKTYDYTNGWEVVEGQAL